ncbi:SRPBCC family protein [Actinomadura fulvescens]|uniref:SRPBCC family protein n=1 Tax=Actinomadura fulvescens TaxID=46160 RepID=A0ABN3P8Y4_9ACTN
MAPFVSQIEIARPADEVFAYVTDPARFPEWQHDVVDVRLGAGETFTTRRRIGRPERTMTQRVTVNDPPRRWAVRALDGPVRPNAEITVEPLGDRSRVTFSLDFEGRGIGRLLVPLVVRRGARKGAPVSYRRLKERLEGVRHTR